MADYFDRQLLLWSKQEQDSLAKKSIAIIGSGGLGCSIGIALSGLGIGNIYIIDFDKIEIHNIHRQIAFKIADIGKYKSYVLSNLINERSLVTKAHSKQIAFDNFTKLNIDVDIIIDATDNLKTRASIDKYAKSTNTPWVYGSVADFVGQVAFFDKAHFRDIFTIADVATAGIAAPMVMSIASFQANLVTRYLVNKQIQKDVLHYMYFDESGNYNIKKFNF